MASSGSAEMSDPKGVADQGPEEKGVPKGFAKASNIALWACKVVEFCRGVLKLGANTEDDLSALATMPQDEYAICFSTVATYLELHGSSGLKGYAADAIVQPQYIFRWKHLGVTQEILSCPDVLDDYRCDDKGRDLYAIADSTLTFNDVNKTPTPDGKAMGKAYAERKASWEGVTRSLVVLGQDAAKTEDLLEILKSFIATSCYGDPASFRGILLMVISMNDVRQGKQSLPDEKLDSAKKIIALLKLFPIGSVAFVGPGSEENWSYPAGTFTHLAERYYEVFLSSGHPIFNPEHVYSRMEMNHKLNYQRHAKAPGSKQKGDFIRDSNGEKAEFWTRDIHFKERDSNYTAMCEAITEIARCTQFLGNVADVARQIGHDLGDTVHFPFESDYGAKPEPPDASASASSSSVSAPKGSATSSGLKGFVKVKEEQGAESLVLL